MIFDPNTGAAVADSIIIAKYLDETYPDTPRLIPEGTAALHKSISTFLWDNITIPVGMSVPIKLFRMTPRSEHHIRSSVERMFGKSPEDLCSEENWATVERALGKLAEVFAFNGAGRDMLIGGESICFADLELAALLMSPRIALGPESEQWRKIAGWNGGKWERFIAQFEPYTTVE